MKSYVSITDSGGAVIKWGVEGGIPAVRVSLSSAEVDELVTLLRGRNSTEGHNLIQTAGFSVGFFCTWCHRLFCEDEMADKRTGVCPGKPAQP